ncbi:MAG: hypothetical protein J0I84_17385 [Terrimonas sp.]|nr:hypothetical protein [Terrimonas sp.]OJY95781.1 MAG: hypothetical protein BGP13_00325 [Sphingobacteriales bacterium 40-81]
MLNSIMPVFNSMFLFLRRVIGSVLMVFICCNCYAQDIAWMSGVWKGTGIVPGSLYSTDYVRTLYIDKVAGNRFMGKLVSEVRDGKGTRQDIAFTGLYENSGLKFNYGQVLYTKEPPYGQWWDCRACNSTSVIRISADTILLTLTNINCGQTCDGETKYYKLLSGFDAAVQKKITGAFGDKEVSKNINAMLKNDTAKTVVPPVIDTLNQLARTNTVIATYKVFSPEIKIMLFDNGEIDTDIVSVYHNGNKIIDKKILGTTPIVYTITASADKRTHEFILVAENLGDIPPNTAFMRIISGDDHYELFAKTNLQENAAIKIEYAGK